MLRIGPPPPPQGGAMPPPGPPPGPSLSGGSPPPLPPEGGPDDAANPPEGAQSKYDAEKASQAIVVYRDPSMGPFACGNCRQFDGQGACAIVQGAIDPAGLCNLFESSSDKDASEDPDQADDQAPPPSLGPPPPQ